MIRVTVLGSGSSGNATVLECGSTRLLIDAGFSAKKLTERLEAVNIPPDTLSGILITHEHTDHIQAIPVFTKKWDIPVYVTRLTMESMPKKPDHIRWQFFESGHSFPIGNVIVTSFPIPHDAADPVGFRFDYQGACYGHLSDSGNITEAIRSTLERVHILFIESNYDPELLENDTKRPWATKQRIASRHGHLSNKQAGEFVCSCGHPDLRHVILGHLSKDCNTPEIARSSMLRTLSDHFSEPPEVHHAPADGILGWIYLSGESEGVLPDIAPHQQKFLWS